MKLKEFFSKSAKEDIYIFYQKIQINPKDYEKITRYEIYNEIMSCYREDPEVILKLCSMEEIHILKKLLDGPILKSENGYIDYLLMKDLMDNYLILLEDGKYYIPEDLINYVKMAINLLNEEKYNILDVKDSVILGILRISNVLLLDDFEDIFKNYCINDSALDIKEYIINHPKLNHRIEIVRYQKKEYIISKENYYFKDVLKMREYYVFKKYSLEEVISVGKYKLNLFQEDILRFLSFLEIHLDSRSIDLLIDDLIFYGGFHINDEAMLLQICDHIEDLYKEVKKVVSNFPNWIYNEEENQGLLSDENFGKINFWNKMRNFWNKVFK